MTHAIVLAARRALTRLRQACRITDQYGRHYTLRFTAFLFAASFSSTLIVETATLPPII